MRDAAAGSPRSRLQEARKQLRIALEDIKTPNDGEDTTVELDIMAAAADVENALSALESGDQEDGA